MIPHALIESLGAFTVCIEKLKQDLVTEHGIGIDLCPVFTVCNSEDPAETAVSGSLTQLEMRAHPPGMNSRWMAMIRQVVTLLKTDQIMSAVEVYMHPDLHNPDPDKVKEVVECWAASGAWAVHTLMPYHYEVPRTVVWAEKCCYPIPAVPPGASPGSDAVMAARQSWEGAPASKTSVQYLSKIGDVRWIGNPASLEILGVEACKS